MITEQDLKSYCETIPNDLQSLQLAMKFQILQDDKLAVRGDNRHVLPGKIVQVMDGFGYFETVLGKLIQENVPLASGIINICLVKSRKYVRI